MKINELKSIFNRFKDNTDCEVYAYNYRGNRISLYSGTYLTMPNSVRNLKVEKINWLSNEDYYFSIEVSLKDD